MYFLKLLATYYVGNHSFGFGLVREQCNSTSVNLNKTFSTFKTTTDLTLQPSLHFVIMSQEHGTAMDGNLGDVRDDTNHLESSPPRLTSEVPAFSFSFIWASLVAVLYSIFNRIFCLLKTKREDLPASSSNSEPSPSVHSSSTSTESECTDDLESEIEASRNFWSEVQPMSDTENSAEADAEAFESLQKQWPAFFKEWSDELEVGKKIAEGAQGEIWEASYVRPDGTKRDIVLKVFKRGYALQDLRKQWPLGMLDQGLRHYFRHSCPILGGTLLKNGRFAFRMWRFWGDLGKLIKLKMQQNHYQGPPFTFDKAKSIMLEIARGMQELHEDNILHRDLKSGNVLIDSKSWNPSSSTETFDPTRDVFYCYVADFECSVGVVGTKFWREPAILQHVKNESMGSIEFSQAGDIYSYAMTCYEILTGCIPFDDLQRNDYIDVVLSGNRPTLPNYIGSSLKALLNRCWHQDPLQRPSFKEIVNHLHPPGWDWRGFWEHEPSSKDIVPDSLDRPKWNGPTFGELADRFETGEQFSLKEIVDRLKNPRWDQPTFDDFIATMTPIRWNRPSKITLPKKNVKVQGLQKLLPNRPPLWPVNRVEKGRDLGRPTKLLRFESFKKPRLPLLGRFGRLPVVDICSSSSGSESESFEFSWRPISRRWSI